jgi:hypothetical protein
MIGQAIMDPNPDRNEFQLGLQLAENYAEIANRDPIRIATMEALGLPILPPYIVTPTSQFLEISVTDSIPERAQAVANELARQLILLGPAGAGLNEKSRQEFVNEQLDTMETQIQTTQVRSLARGREHGAPGRSRYPKARLTPANKTNDVAEQLC